MDADDIAGLTARGARELLDSGEASSVELTRAYLDRIEITEPAISAFVTLTPDLALRQAAEADSRIARGEAAPLTGVPMQIKDNMSTKGVRTTCASRMLERFVPTYDATVVRRLYDQGGALLGKGNLDEFAMGSSTENSAFFPTKNPWDVTRAPGGSSGGPAAAVAAGQCVYALGSDTGGSIRQPAALCGVVGLKPTYGLVSRYGLIAFASSLDQIGPITRDVHDAAIVLNAIAGHDPLDATSMPDAPPDYAMALTGDIRGLRVGVPMEYFPPGIEPGVESAARRAIDVLADLGAEVADVSLPSTRYAMPAYYIIAPSEASANLARYDGVKYGYATDSPGSMWDALENTRREGFGPEVKRRVMIGAYALSAGYYDAWYKKALQARALIRREFDSVFQKFDVLVSPTSPTAAFRLGEKMDDPYLMYLNDVFTQPANIAGIPAISVPAGLSEGLPVGLQFMAGRRQEERLLRAAHAYEQATPWRELRPDL